MAGQGGPWRVKAAQGRIKAGQGSSLVALEGLGSPLEVGPRSAEEGQGGPRRFEEAYGGPRRVKVALQGSRLSHPGTLSAVTRYCPLWARRPSRFCFRQLRSSFPVGHPSWDCSSIIMLNLGVPIPSEAAEPPKGLALDWMWACTYTAHNPSPLADVGYYNPPPLGVRRPRRHTRATRQSGSDTIVTSQDPFRRNTILSALGPPALTVLFPAAQEQLPSRSHILGLL
ncbi:hypothetical protein ACLB2K_061641 [Fragaria x ananassa]